MKIANRPGRFTFDDYLTLVPEGRKGDLIDGVIYLTPPECGRILELGYWLFRLLADFSELRDLGSVTVDKRTYRLDDRNACEPDVAFLWKKESQRILKNYIAGPPNLAVEIVSPESVERDYRKKRLAYEKAGVAEYWIIDEEERKVTFLRLDGKGKYREVKPKDGVLRSAVVPGFWIRVDWLWEETRPTKIEALKEILGN